MIVPCPEQAVSSGLLMDMGVSDAERATREECWWQLLEKFLVFWNFCLFRRGPCHHPGLIRPRSRHLHWRRHQLLRDRLDLAAEKDGGCRPRSDPRGTEPRAPGTRGHSRAARTGGGVHPETENNISRRKIDVSCTQLLCRFLSAWVSLCAVAFQVCHMLRFTSGWMVCAGSVPSSRGPGLYTELNNIMGILWPSSSLWLGPGEPALWQWLDNGGPSPGLSQLLFSP